MNACLAIYANFLRLTFKKPVNWFFYFAAPVLAFALMSVLFGLGDARPLKIGYLNRDEGPLGADLVAHLGRNAANVLAATAADAAETRVLEGAVAVFMDIPPDYSRRLADPAGPAPAVRLMSLEGETAAAVLRADIDFYSGGLAALYRAAGADAAAAEKLRVEFRDGGSRPTVRSVRDQASRRTAGSIGFGSLVYILLMQAIVLTGLSLREKENRTFARIRSAPVPGAAYALGNLLAAFTVLAAQVTATLLILRFALGMDLTVPFGAAAALLLALSLAAIGAGVMIAGLAGSSLEASLAGNLAVTVSTLLSGCFWPIDALPAFLRRAAVVFPQTWVMEAVAGLQRGAPAASLAPAILVLLAFAALFAAAAAYGFRSGRDQRRFG